MCRLVLRSIALTAAAGLLAACSSMPEWTKPSTWIDGVTETGATVEEKAEAEPAAATTASAPVETTATSATALPPVVDPLEEAPPGPRIKPTDKPTEFPNLATQSAPREAVTTESQRREIRDSLVADRDRAQHTADELRGGTQPAAAPPAPAPKAATPAVAPATTETAEEKSE